MSSINRTLKSLAPALLACAIALATTASVTLAAPTPPVSVTACGILSANNTIYELTNDITTSTNGDCLVLKGSNSALDLHNFNIERSGQGSSHGSGILIKGDDDLIEGADGTVSGFRRGVTDLGRSTMGDGLNLDNNVIGLMLSGHTDRWTNMEEAGNSWYGIWFFFCSDDCSATDFFAASNGIHGVLVEASDGAKLDLFTATENTVDGIHIGAPHRIFRNKGVKVVDGFAGDPETPLFGPNNEFGIVLDDSEAKAADQVAFVRAKGNIFDLVDETANCGNDPFNVWFDNDYLLSQAGGTSSPACILAPVDINDTVGP
jgi:hypothetical protein